MKTYKRTWRFHPMTAWLDRGNGTGEALAIELRNGTAGAVHGLVDHIRNVAHCQFSVGMRLQGHIRQPIHTLDEHDDRWVTAICQNGTPRPRAAVAEITDLVELTSWPAGSRLLVSREPLHPGAQQTFDDLDGYRFTAFLIDQTDTDLAVLDAHHRAHARGRGPHPLCEEHLAGVDAL